MQHTHEGSGWYKPQTPCLKILVTGLVQFWLLSNRAKRGIQGPIFGAYC